MNNHRWAVIAGALLLALIVGSIAYNVGLTQGAEGSGRIAGAYPHQWHGPWGFGFFFGPLLFFAFWFLVIRGLFWGGRHRRRAWLEDWHRREHERMWNGEDDPHRR
jgi:hypothetical protein